MLVEIGDGGLTGMERRGGERRDWERSAVEPLQGAFLCLEVACSKRSGGRVCVIKRCSPLEWHDLCCMRSGGMMPSICLLCLKDHWFFSCLEQTLLSA